MAGKIIAVNTSGKRGTKKDGVGRAILAKDHGIEGDAHAGDWGRQVSLLAAESIEKMKKTGLDVGPGDFGENLTTQGIDLLSLKIGTRLRVAERILLQVTQIGKVCEEPCAIFYQVGDCVMPKEGIFARVLEGGGVCPGDPIEAEP